MKRTSTIFLAVLMTVVSCVRETAVTPASIPVFEAVFDSTPSKAVLIPGKEASKVEWTEGDQVSVLVSDLNIPFTALSDGPSTQLETESKDVPDVDLYYALYPYDTDASLADGKISTTLPASQTAVQGSFSTHLAVAQTTDTRLPFKNVCGLIKVTVDSDNVTSIVFEGNSDEIVAGKINISVTDTPSWEAVQNQGSTSVTLLPASGSTIAKGTYYFSVLPQTFVKGFKVTAYKSGGENSVVRNVSAEYTLQRAGIVGGRAFGIDGSGTETDPYILKTAQDIVDMRSLSTVGSETWFKMAADINMSSVKNYVPVNWEENFERKINFDGDGHTISNFSCSGGTYPSLFGVLYGSCRNLTITNAEISGAGSACGILGGYVGTADKPATVSNVSVQGTLSTSKTRVGGMAGVARAATFTDCSTDVVIETSNTDAGGFAGRTQGECSFTKCTSKTHIKSSAASSNRVGGFIGWNSSKNTTCTDCHVLEGTELSDVSEKTSAADGVFGGFIGYGDSSDGTITVISKCSAVADVHGGKSNYVSAFIGRAGYDTSTTTIKDSWSAGSVSGYSYIGGIIGGTTSTTTISRCWSSATITADGQRVGGIVGTNQKKSLTIEDCYSTGEITAKGQQVGGIIGCIQYPATVSNCYSTGNITSNTSGSAGIIGSIITEGSSVSKCIAWNRNITCGRTSKDKWAPGAIIGAAQSGTYSGCYRTRDINFTDNAGAMTLEEHGDVISAVPPAPSYSTSTTQTAYHGRTTTATTVSAAAESIGWNEDVWNLTGELPVLKEDYVESDGALSSAIYPVAGGYKVETLKTEGYFTQTEIAEGITHYHFCGTDDVSGAKQNVNVLEIDLDNDKYKVVFKYSSTSDSTSSVAVKNNALAAINGTYETDAVYVRINGQNKSTVSIASDHVRYWKHNGAIVADGLRKVGIINGAPGQAATPEGGQNAIALYRSLMEKNIMSAAPMLIDDFDPVGASFVPSDLTTSFINNLEYEDYRRHQGVRHPRTAVALTADNDLLLIVVDGRTSIASGMSARELTNFLVKHFDPRWALNMDGGGSSTMYIKGHGNPVNNVVNNLIETDNEGNIVQRKVKTHILISNN